jgi:hypothetical protein
MITVLETFTASKSWQLTGHFFRLLSTVSPVDVFLHKTGQPASVARAVEKGFYSREEFDKITIVTSASEAVKFVIADEEAGYDRSFTTVAQASQLTNAPEVTVGNGAAAEALAAAASRTYIIFRSLATNTNNIGLGALAGLTLAAAPILLTPGDIWRETKAAPAQWAAITDAAGQKLEILTGT